MAKVNRNNISKSKKTTRQGEGTYTRKNSPGGETFYGGKRAGSTPGKSRRRRKPYRGQGK